METQNVLVIVLLAVGIAGVGFLVWALIETARTLRSVRTLSDDVRSRLVPLLDKVDVTIDAVNMELLRVDAIVTRVEEVTDRVSNTSRTVQEVANAPVEIVTGIADKVRTAWRGRKRHE